MKPNDVYYGKAEGLAKYSDYPVKIKLIRKVEGKHFANEGQWVAVSYYVPKYANKYSYVYLAELCQIWSAEQIAETFDIPNLVK